jgi:hypothetical protein
MLFYVRLCNRDKPPASPQKNFNCTGVQARFFNQKNLAAKAHQDTVEHLRHAASNHALERRLFH